MKKASREDIRDVLVRGTSQIIDRSSMEKLLTSGKKLRVKLGIDPTAPDLHLGSAAVLRKLKQFQDLGHTIVLIIGDFTGQIGDPSGKSKTRHALTESEVKRNQKTYLAQARKIIDIRKAEVHHNSEWYKKGGLKTLLRLTASASIQQVMKREDFRQRLASGGDVTILETLYPLLQGYDSVAVKADIEIGGQDQLLNMLMGRRVQRYFGLPEQQVLTISLLVGTDGIQKMSKSIGNYVALTDAPNDMFGKLMSMPDRLMHSYFELCTDIPPLESEQLIRSGNPRDAKLRLAREIVGLYHGKKAAVQAEERFKKVFSRKEVSDDIPELRLPGGHSTAADIPLIAGIAKSKSEAWRLVEQGGVKVNDKALTDPRAMVSLKAGDVVKIGKKNFFRVKI
ncbi:MAG: tyrosyl-tRNA synthetase [Candidatus Parcubacteria bacterium]|jgi:tyrosyl-tRNA synthetase